VERDPTLIYASSGALSRPERAQLQYHDTALNIKARQGVDRLADPPLHLGLEVVNILQPRGDETILDAACGDGSDLWDWFLQTHHEGPMLGIDKHPNLFYAKREEIEREFERLPAEVRNLPGVEFIMADAHNIPLGDGSVDIVICKNALYEMEDLEKVLEEIYRVLQDDGIFVAVTSTSNNKPRQRLFEQMVRSYLSILRDEEINIHPRMNESFDTEKAKEILPKHFTIFDQVSYYSDAYVRSGEQEILYNSLRSMKNDYYPIPRVSQMEQSISDLVTPIVEQEIERLGSFKERIERDIFFCAKNFASTQLPA
jgi:ubiquinone/menaquinone biosynthesis C-methylase UbiE